MANNTEQELRDFIGIALFGPKYYDYILTPPKDPPGKYPSPRAIAELDRVMERIEAEATRAKIDALDHIIDLQDKQFNKWTQTDIANFFAGVGKYYRELKRQAEGGK